jgi:DNA primase
MFSQDTIERVASSVDIVDVISSYFPLKRAGAVFKARCPFHNEKTPSFSVNPSRQIFKCFGCGIGGGVFRFLMEYEHLDFPTAVRRLAERSGLRIEESESSGEEAANRQARQRILAANAAASAFFQKQLFKSEEATVAREYLKGRGIRGEVARRWGIGYAPDGWDRCLNHLISKGFSPREISDAGLTSSREDGSTGSYDRFRNRVMFPICNDTGEVIAFSGRTLDPNPKAAKYVNSPETPVFTKGAVLFGIHMSKRDLINAKSAIICEGQIDLITAFESGVRNVTAPQGTAFTSRQASLLKRYVDEVILCFDSDDAGQKAAERSLPELLAQGLGVRLAVMPRGDDPDSMIRRDGPEMFLNLVRSAPDFFDQQYKTLRESADFQSARGKAAIARKISTWLGWVSDPFQRDAYLKKASTLLELEEHHLRNETSALARKQSFRRETAHEKPPETQPTQTGASSEDSSPLDPSGFLADPTLRLLASCVLNSQDARFAILELPWREVLESDPSGFPLVQLLDSCAGGGETATPMALLTKVSSEAESALCQVQNDPLPADPVNLAQACWNELQKRRLRARIRQLSNRQRSPNLSHEEAHGIHGQIVDLQTRLRQIP